MLTPPPVNEPHRISIMYPAEEEEEGGFDVTRHPKFLKFLMVLMVVLFIVVVSLVILLVIHQLPTEYYPEWFKKLMGADWGQYKQQ